MAESLERLTTALADRYRIERELGHGGMATVYLAEDLKHGRRVAIEPRLKTAVLYVAGLTMERGRPEVDPIHYLPRVRLPVVMLNGKYDFFFPTETAQRPFFERLGTPPADKKWVVYEGGHDVPRPRLIAETLAWLDKYLGPVR